MTTAAKEKAPDTKSKITPEVEAVAERFIAGAKVDETTGAIAAPDRFYYNEGELVGLTEETLNNVHEFNKTCAAGTSLGFGRLGVEAMERKKGELQSVSCDMPTVGGGRMELYMPHSSTGRNPRTGETTTTHGRPSVDWVTGVGEKGGQMSHVLSHLKELGAAKLGNS